MKSLPGRRLLLVANVADFFVLHRLPLAETARMAGWQVHVATPDEPEAEKIRAAGFPWWPVWMDRSGLNPVRDLRTTRDLLRLYETLRPEVVHHVTTKAVLHGTLAARRIGGIRVVNTFAGLGYLFTNHTVKTLIVRNSLGMVYRRILRGPNVHTTFENANDRKLFLERGWVDEEHSSVIWGGGIDTGRFRPFPPRASGPITVVMAGRLLRPKGVEVFVEAARLVRRADASIRMALVGWPDHGNPQSATESDLTGWAREGAVEWWGRREDMENVFREADIVALPTHYGEGVPRVLMEAAACGLAVVTTDVPGCNDLIMHEATGLLVPVKNARALADAILRLARDPTLRDRLGEAARRTVSQQFSLEEVSRSFLDLYGASPLRNEPDRSGVETSSPRREDPSRGALVGISENALRPRSSNEPDPDREPLHPSGSD